MKIRYNCDFCYKTFSTEKECLEHEKLHKGFDEFEKNNPQKYFVGDVVLIENETIHSKITSIEGIKIDISEDEKLERKYAIGYDKYSHICYVKENDIKKVIISSKDFNEKIIPEITSIFNKYDENIEIIRDDYDRFEFFIDFDKKQ